MRSSRTPLCVAATLILSTCRTLPPQPEMPAVLVTPSAATRAELARALSQLLHRPVILADDALADRSVLVLERNHPRDPSGVPLSGRDLDQPEQLRLVKVGTECVLLHEGTGQRATLPTATCAAEPAGK